MNRLVETARIIESTRLETSHNKMLSDILNLSKFMISYQFFYFKW
jgi:hypothetical protein